MRKILSSIIFTIWVVVLQGQTVVSQNFTIANGLPSNRVYHSLVDAQGFVWFSTDKGVSKYDGYNFTNYTTLDGLTDNEVFNMFEDSKHRIWFMTYSGKLSYYKEGKFYNPNNTPFLRAAITEGMFSRAYEDKWGNILFITSADGAYILQDTIFKNYFKNSGFYKPYLSNNQLYFTATKTDTVRLVTITKDAKPKILDTNYYAKLTFHNWLKGDSLYSLSSSVKNSHKWILFKSKKDELKFKKTSINLSTNVSLFFAKKMKGKVYLGTNKGLFIANYKTGELTKVGYSNEHISSATFDFEGNLWVTTLQQGVFLQPKINLNKFKNISNNINKVKVNPFTKMVWAGSPRVLYEIGDEIKNIYKLPTTITFNEKITAFYFIDKNNSLIGSDMCLATYKNGIIKTHPDLHSGIKSLTFNPFTKKIMGSFASGLAEISLDFTKRKEPVRISNGRSTCVLAINDSILLVGSNNGLYKTNTFTKKWDLILNSRINLIQKDTVGNIWCGSDLSGLYLYKNGKFTNFTEKDGLHSNSINSLLIDANQNIWLTSPFGIIKITYTNNIFRAENFILSNILGREQVNDVALKGDTVLVATTAGLYYFKENQLKKDTIPPPLVINSIIVEGKNLPISTSYSLNYEQNNIHIDFTGLSYSTKNINYRYTITPGAKTWQYTSNRSINLVDINPGKYVLTIQAIKDGTIYSEAKQIKFIIIPPFYRAWWFYVAAFVCIALLLYLAFRYRVNSIRKRAYVSQILSESKQKALRAQMNPHFLFNSLISIQSFFLNKRNTEGQEYTSKFSKLIRNILDNSDKEFITIDDEIANLTNYTDLEKIRLKTPFIFTITVDGAIDENNTYMPTMLLQPIIENAIWHGINYLQNIQGVIMVRFEKEGDNLKITIDDNGVGFEKSAEINKKRNHISKGTQLIKDRLDAINFNRKVKVGYSAKDKPEGGARVTLIIPLEKE